MLIVREPGAMSSATAPGDSPDDDRRFFEELRAREFARLDRAGVAYLDFTGSALYPQHLVAEHAAYLRDAVLGNPHSEHGPSRASTAAVDAARHALLAFLDADPAEYAVCFTANASGALRLVGESYPFAPGGAFVLAADDHNSVNGIRRYARRRGAAVHYLPLDEQLRLAEPQRRLERIARAAGRTPRRTPRRIRSASASARPTSSRLRSTRSSATPRASARSSLVVRRSPGCAARGSPAGRSTSCRSSRRSTDSAPLPTPSRTERRRSSR